MNNIKEEIKNGFDALAGGVHDAGKRRVDELVKKQGYVAYKNKNAADLFRKDLEYIDWKLEFVDGEYRFYPPIKEQKEEKIADKPVETNSIVETYKKAKKQYLNTRITIKMLKDNMCEYNLIAIDPRTGEKTVIDSGTYKFSGKFTQEVLPSLYYHLCDGLPVTDYVKDEIVNFVNIENDYMMFGGINKEQMELIYQMKDFVDERLLFNKPKR